MINEQATVLGAFMYAADNGYKVPRSVYSLVSFSETTTLRDIPLAMVTSVLFSHDFAKAFFGSDQVDEYGQSLNTIRLYAEQVAYKFDGKIYEADRQRPYMTVAKFLENDYDKKIDPTTLVNVESVTLKLEDMSGSISFDTHKITEIEVYGAGESWKWHLQNMVLCTDPIRYIAQYMQELK